MQLGHVVSHHGSVFLCCHVGSTEHASVDPGYVSGGIK